MDKSGLKNINLIVISFMISLLIPGYLYSQESFEYKNFNTPKINLPSNKSFYLYLFDFDFNQADSVINTLITSSENTLQTNLMQANLLWWKVLSGEDIKQNIKNCEEFIDNNIDLYTSNKCSDHPENYLVFLQSSLMKLRIANYNGQKLSGLNKLMALRKEIKNLLNNTSPAPDEKLILGIYLYFYEYIKEKYPFSVLILNDLTEGDKKSGIFYLEQCSNSPDPVLKTQGNYFLYKIYHDIEKDFDKSMKYITLLCETYPENIVYKIEQYKTLVNKANLMDAKELKNKMLYQITHSSNLTTQQKIHFQIILQNSDL